MSDRLMAFSPAASAFCVGFAGARVIGTFDIRAIFRLARARSGEALRFGPI